MTTPTTRFATSDDIPQLVEVINRAYVVEAALVHGLRVDRMDVRGRLNEPNTWFLVIDAGSDENPGKLAGCVCLHCDGQRGHIGLLSVDPDFQRRGLGGLLLRAAESLCARNMGCAQIELEVVSLREELFGFYASMGYERAGIIPFPDESRLKQPAHMVVMRRAK